MCNSYFHLHLVYWFMSFIMSLYKILLFSFTCRVDENVWLFYKNCRSLIKIKTMKNNCCKKITMKMIIQISCARPYPPWRHRILLPGYFLNISFYLTQSGSFYKHQSSGYFRVLLLLKCCSPWLFAVLFRLGAFPSYHLANSTFGFHCLFSQVFQLRFSERGCTQTCGFMSESFFHIVDCGFPVVFNVVF